MQAVFASNVADCCELYLWGGGVDFVKVGSRIPWNIANNAKLNSTFLLETSLLLSLIASIVPFAFRVRLFLIFEHVCLS